MINHLEKVYWVKRTSDRKSKSGRHSNREHCLLCSLSQEKLQRNSTQSNLFGRASSISCIFLFIRVLLFASPNRSKTPRSLILSKTTQWKFHFSDKLDKLRFDEQPNMYNWACTACGCQHNTGECGSTYVREQNNGWMDGERDSHALSSQRNISEHDFENI